MSSKTSVNPLLMGASIPDLRRKLGGARGTLGKYWSHFLALARGDAEWYGLYQPLAYIVTGDAGFKKAARAAFLKYADLVPEGDVSLEAQVHTHVVSAPLAHWAILYDWACGSGILRPAEREHVAGALLAQAQKFPMQQVQGRTRGYDNQVFSNAFACTAVGYVLGCRRGDDPLARRMLGLGLAWVRALFDDLPADGYTLEGSTYHEQVSMPVTLWATALYEEATGQAVFETPFGPHGVSVRDMVEYSCNMISPAGLVPPWDAYGHQKASVRSFLVYLARRTGNPEPLRIIRDTRMWDRMAHPAWECHDRMWALAWWPEHLDWEHETPAYRPWIGTKTAGALNDRATRTRLFQYWDECGGLAYSGRTEVNPNAISLEAFGSPVILDGGVKGAETLTPIPVDTVLDYAGRDFVGRLADSWGLQGPDRLERAAKRCVDGNVGISNSLHFDHEDWYVPVNPVHGTGVDCHDLGAFQTLTADACDYYTDRYDVTRVLRTSAMLAGRWCLVRDRVTAASDHAVTWQAFIPADAARDGAAVYGTVPTGVGLAVVPDAALETDIAAAPVFPNHLDVYAEGSARLRFHGAMEDGAWDHAVCLVPYEALVPMDDAAAFSRGWAAVYGGGKAKTIDLCDAMTADPCTAIDRARCFTKTLRIARPPRQCFLRIEKATQGTVCRVNGTPAPARFAAKGERWTGLTTVSQVFDCSGLLKAGLNAIELEAPFFHGETLAGPACLMVVGSRRPAVALQALGTGHHAITVDGQTDHVILDNETGLAQFGDIRTDARHAVRAASGFVAFANATRFDDGRGMVFAGRAPASLSAEPLPDGTLQVVLNALRDNNQFTLTTPQGVLTVDSTGWLFVRWTGKKPLRLRVCSVVPRSVTVNGEADGWMHPGEWREFVVKPLAAKATKPALPGDAYALLGTVADPVKALAQAARSADWTVALAAIEALPLSGAAVDGAALVALLEREAAARPDPDLSRWWRQAKMLHEAGPLTPDTSIPMPQGAKRWRLRRALVTALGKIGYAPAIPLLVRLAEDGRDYFTVTSQLPLALARLGAQAALPVLERQWDHGEINTRRMVRLAVRYLRGEITRDELEAGAPPA